MSSEEEGNLSKLLSALAVGARAVHSLPVEDDFDYESTFPGFHTLAQENKTDLVHILSLALQEDLDQDDPAVWDSCADACDWLLEQAEIYLHNSSFGEHKLEHWSATARQHAQSSYGRMMEGLVEMEKPQQTYEIVVDNDRASPFIPLGVDGSNLTPGRANDTRYGGSPEISFLGDGFIGPSHFAPHAKRDQIVALGCTYEAPANKPEPVDSTTDVSDSPHHWIDTVDKLNKLAKKLESVKQVAVDLEAHSYRSFAGIVCLMQMTFATEKGSEDYLIDTLALWRDLHSALAPVFANPNILKVMHGADSDVVWLQRDFGIYIVNLLDTGRAARLLKLPSFGLAHLLKSYVKITVDKTHQMSDWRQRPLPDDMQLYAKLDTHYLLDVAQHLLWDVDSHSSPEVTLEKLFEASQQVCLIRYDKEIFRVQGYKSLVNSKRKSKTELSETQEEVLSSLFDWRDLVARDCDESAHFVCPNKGLLRLALACPTTVTTLQSLLNPMPPLVLRFAQDILERVNQVLKEAAGPPSAAFFKPAEPEEDSPPRGLLSPVLGTEALYKQAGWMTPSVHDAHASTEDDDMDVGDGVKPKNLLVVDDANKEYRTGAGAFTSHSLSMGSFSTPSAKNKNNNNIKTADGLGAASGLVVGSKGEVQEAAERAQRSADNVRRTMGETHLLGLISPSIITDDCVEEDDEEREEEEDKENGDSETEFEIPRSMREIYKVSNRNRRNKKTSSSQTAEREVAQGNPMEVDTLEGAEAVLAARGSGYFDSTNSKRQKHDEGGEDSNNNMEQQQQHVSQDEDIAFMQQIGWVKDKEEAETLKPRPREDSEDFDATTEEDGKQQQSEKQDNVVKPFDYSTVGNIGVYDPAAPPAANPFFTGAAVAGSGFNQGSSGPRRDTGKAKRGGKGRSGRGGRQERPQKNEGRSFVYKKK